MPNTPVVFDDVEVVAETGLTLRCRIQDKEVVIGNAQWLAGTTVHHVGDRGRLVLPRWAVDDLGLTPPGSS